MAFTTTLDETTVITEHVVSDPDRLSSEASREGYAVTPYAIRVVWTVDVQFGEVVVRADNWAKVQGGSGGGGGTKSERDGVARSKVPDTHIEAILRRIALDHGPGYQDITLVFPGSGAPRVNGRDAYEEADI